MIGKIKKISLRELWKKEDKDFTKKEKKNQTNKHNVIYLVFECVR